MNIFVAERIARDLTTSQLSNLKQEFESYQKTGNAGQYLGRDADLDRPNSAVAAELGHIHIHPNFLTGMPVNAQTNMLKGWRIMGRQHDRRSDTWLIYCQGTRAKDNFLLIAFLNDNAHVRANKITFIGQLADEAEIWRRKY